MVINDGEGGISVPARKPVTLVPVNDGPVLRLNATSATYISSASPVSLAPTATLTDVDNPTFFNRFVDGSGGCGAKEQREAAVERQFFHQRHSTALQDQAIGLVVRDGSAGAPLVCDSMRKPRFQSSMSCDITDV